jgi:DNA excision repair protein ERCC-2
LSTPSLNHPQHYPERRKLIYCSRTVPEIEKALAELKRLMEYRRDREGLNETFLGLGLTSRKNLCVHPSVSKEKKGKAVDARCRDLTSAWVCEKGRKEPGSVELCDWHEKLGELEPGSLLPSGVFTLDEVKAYGIRHGICPYFAVRRMVRPRRHLCELSLNAAQLPHVDVIIYSFHYLLDPKVAEQVSKEMSKDAIVVFDEAHNIGAPRTVACSGPSLTTALRQRLHRIAQH